MGSVKAPRPFSLKFSAKLSMAEELPFIYLTPNQLAELPEYSTTLPDSYKRPVDKGGKPWKRNLKWHLRDAPPDWIRGEWIPHEDPTLLGIKWERILVASEGQSLKALASALPCIEPPTN